MVCRTSPNRLTMFQRSCWHDPAQRPFYIIDSLFPLCSDRSNGGATLQDRKMFGPRDEVIARVENFLICKAAFEKALFVYPDAHLEMRQGARIILKSKVPLS